MPLDVCQPAISTPVVAVTFASNLLTDPYLILIPIPMLWQSSLKPIKKIAATIVLSSGVFILVCATIKSVSLLVVSSNIPAFPSLKGNYLTSLVVFYRILNMVHKTPMNGALAKHSSQWSRPICPWSFTSSEFGSAKFSAANFSHLTRHINRPRVVSGVLVAGVTIPAGKVGVLGIRILWPSACHLPRVRNGWWKMWRCRT